MPSFLWQRAKWDPCLLRTSGKREKRLAHSFSTPQIDHTLVGETSRGAPKAWKMSLAPSDATAETIPGDPTHVGLDAAENELAMLERRGAGQPYLMAIRLRDEPSTLHLRAYLSRPSATYAWADLRIAPLPVQELAVKTSRVEALAWKTFAGGEDGLFFDPTQNHNAWMPPTPFAERLARKASETKVGAQLSATAQGDAAAEDAESDSHEVDAFRKQIEKKDYTVPDSTVKMKTRGSAQKAFANAVKSNYGNRCAITGIKTKDFLVASHIVPWSRGPEHSARPFQWDMPFSAYGPRI